MTNRIAYLISVYKDPVHLQRLVSALSYSVEEYVSFFVHVDAKVDESAFRQSCKKTNVFLLKIVFGCNGVDTLKLCIKKNY